MRALMKKISFASIIIMAMVFAGCILSGTFIIDQEFSFTASSADPYFVAIDITTNEDWEDHKDKIDMIDAVGFKMEMNNQRGAEVTFNVYVAPYSDTKEYTTKDELDAHAYVVIEDLTVPAGESTLTYAQSLAHIKNLTILKNYAKSGKFSYYGLATGGTSGAAFEVNGEVILTVTAGK
jgi:hypothetical protein